MFTTWALVAILSGAGQPSGGAVDLSAEVKAAYESFNRAVETGHTQGALRLLHPQLVVFEMGHVEGSRDDFQRDHLPADIEVMKTSKLEGPAPTIHVAEGGRFAWVLSTYRLTGTYKDRILDSEGTTTAILVRSQGGWLIRHLHYSSHPRKPQ